MAIAPTYPGVYVEEIPSGVHTITGVATSITAFVGYTPRGPVDTPVQIFSFADFERAFGGLSVESILSYCVKHFFQNGGSEAYVVRTAHGAVSASVTLLYGAAAADESLLVTAASDGVWGNGLQVDIDYATTNPNDLFNLTVAEYALQSGVVKQTQLESYRNLSMYESAATDAVATVNAGSQLIQLTRLAPANAPSGGYSESGFIVAADYAQLGPSKSRVAVSVDGSGPWDIDLTGVTDIASLVTALQTGLAAQGALVNVTHSSSASGDKVTITSQDTTHASAVHVLNASANNAAGALHMGLANGGTEASGWSGFRPVQTGTVGSEPTFPLSAGSNGRVTIDVYSGAGAAPTGDSIQLQIWSAAPAPTSLDELVTMMNAAIQHASMSEPRLVGASVSNVGGVLRLAPGPASPNTSFAVSNTGGDTTAADLGFVGATRNVGRYAPGSGVTAGAQVAGTAGNDGTTPTDVELTGDESAKTGLYALANVDLFNLLVMPDATASGGMMDVLTEAIAYCEKRRAMMIIDVPEQTARFDQAQTWGAGSDAGSLRSRNSALYFPRLREPDPQMGGVVRSFPAAGALAGLFARTDAERGVWKAPAGTAAMLAGATGLSYLLTDAENGVLNPLAINCLRTFPVIGTVSWGARTARGADVLADEYKYIPVRRLALFLEESLYRGTQWAVFEPNDEPLWAQIRLNLGAFMHQLYAQGAFEGSTPRDAYFVKCDSETTTQNDIDLGRVNIVVGFAPLKPAEFVVIQIQQIAGAIQT